MLKRLLLALALVGFLSPAVAQWQVPNNAIPVGRGAGVTGFNSVAGSTGTGSGCIVDTNPPTFVGCITTAAAPVIPVIHPSSGNLVGTGCATAHQIWWVDQNLCSTADVWSINSSDPSAIFQVTIGGTITNGDTVSLTFDFTGACAGGPAGCKVTYAVTGADTTTTIAKGLACAIANNSTLFRLNGGSCSNGAVNPPAAGYGGYATGKQIGYVVATTPLLSLDFDSRVSMKVTAQITGAATETVTFVNTNCGTVCSSAWDNNPVISMARSFGVAPPPNSQLGVIQFGGSQSASPSSLSVQYGSISTLVLNSTTGALSSRIQFVTPDINGVQNQGLFVGAGAYTVGVGDKGVDSINAKQLWVSGTEELVLSGSIFTMVSGVGHDIQLAPATGAAKISNASDVSLTLQADAATRNVALIWNDGALRWQAYKPASSTDLRFFDGTADRVTFLNGGNVRLNNYTGGITNFAANGTVQSLAGNSGGIPYFNSATSIASSAALANNTLLSGGGAGNAPKTSGLTVTGSDLTSLNASSTVTSLPQFVLTNNVADANPASFLFKKNRAAADTTTNDSFLDYQAYGWANSGQQVSARWQVIQTAASSGSNIPTKQVWNTSNAAGQLNQSLTLDSAAHISVGQATAPTITAGCNGAGSGLTGNDTYGTVTGSTAAATTCTITFGTAYAATPHCVASGLSSPLTGAITPSTTTLVVNFASTANYKFTYHCLGV